MSKRKDMVEDLSNTVDFEDKLPNREDFEKWCGDTSWTPYQKSIMFLAWQAQQKKIDALEALNPDVPCPVRGGVDVKTSYIPMEPDNLPQNVCFYCNGSGTVSTVKALQYRMKQLEDKLIEVMR